jgi:hypothetical protein
MNRRTYDHDARDAKLDVLQQLAEAVASLVTGEDWRQALTFAASSAGAALGTRC